MNLFRRKQEKQVVAVNTTCVLCGVALRGSWWDSRDGKAWGWTHHTADGATTNVMNSFAPGTMNAAGFCRGEPPVGLEVLPKSRGWTYDTITAEEAAELPS